MLAKGAGADFGRAVAIQDGRIGEKGLDALDQGVRQRRGPDDDKAHA